MPRNAESSPFGKIEATSIGSGSIKKGTDFSSPKTAGNKSNLGKTIFPVFQGEKVKITV